MASKSSSGTRHLAFLLYEGQCQGPLASAIITISRASQKFRLIPQVAAQAGYAGPSSLGHTFHQVYL